jgi:hypothetical protein
MSITLPSMIERVRAQIGDQTQPFATSVLGDGVANWFDLPKQQIQYISQIAVVDGASYTSMVNYSSAQPWSSTTTYQVGNQVTYNGLYLTALQVNAGETPVQGGNAWWQDQTSVAYIIDDVLGQLKTGIAPPNNATMVINGQSWALFSDTELGHFCYDALREHFFNRKIEERTLDEFGRIMYRETAVDLTNLPAIEEPLVVMLAVINTFWCMANDLASAINVQTAEGTHIDRSAQYRQIVQQIELLTGRYQDYCAQLGVGMYRAEVTDLRRTSYTTGRLVPLFEPQEYDDHRWATRLLPNIERRNEDNSGLPSPLWNTGYGGGV